MFDLPWAMVRGLKHAFDFHFHQRQFKLLGNLDEFLRRELGANRLQGLLDMAQLLVRLDLDGDGNVFGYHRAESVGGEG